ncbi:MAG: LytTR family DNA-binding domain-containing protein [Lachnospiraceae bacterium]|nr:LytTR family DNA-binding domain-containing protein [Lachnospiraceae bacterium]
MKIAIVDDFADERALLCRRLKRQFAQRGVQADFFEYENGTSFLSATAKEQFTVLFLDIYMDGKNGIDVAKEFRKTDTTCLLIFTTTSTDHALEGFQVRAMHYLVKPYTERDIAALLDEILSRIPKQENYITVKISGSDVRIPLGAIVYAEHFSHMIHIHTSAGKTLVTRQSFGSFIEPLKNDPRFFLCSRGVIINLAHAADFNGTAFVLADGSQISVSRDLSKTARQTFMEFLFQRGNLL